MFSTGYRKYYRKFSVGHSILFTSVLCDLIILSSWETANKHSGQLGLSWGLERIIISTSCRPAAGHRLNSGHTWDGSISCAKSATNASPYMSTKVSHCSLTDLGSFSQAPFTYFLIFSYKQHLDKIHVLINVYKVYIM